VQNMQPLPSRGRAVGFGEAKIPATISVTMPDFVTPDGEKINQHTVRVTTAPKRRANVSMEATCDNFEWLLKAAKVDWDTPAKTDKRRPDPCPDLPELSFPCKYHKHGGGKIKIWCSYRQNGMWKKHQRSVVVDAESGNSNLEGIVRRCESQVLAFYKDNHEATVQDSEAELHKALVDDTEHTK